MIIVAIPQQRVLDLAESVNRMIKLLTFLAPLVRQKFSGGQLENRDIR